MTRWVENFELEHPDLAFIHEWMIRTAVPEHERALYKRTGVKSEGFWIDGGRPDFFEVLMETPKSHLAAVGGLRPATAKLRSLMKEIGTGYHPEAESQYFSYAINTHDAANIIKRILVKDPGAVTLMQEIVDKIPRSLYKTGARQPSIMDDDSDEDYEHPYYGGARMLSSLQNMISGISLARTAPVHELRLEDDLNGGLQLVHRPVTGKDSRALTTVSESDRIRFYMGDWISRHFPNFGTLEQVPDREFVYKLATSSTKMDGHMDYMAASADFIRALDETFGLAPEHYNEQRVPFFNVVIPQDATTRAALLKQLEQDYITSHADELPLIRKIPGLRIQSPSGGTMVRPADPRPKHRQEHDVEPQALIADNSAPTAADRELEAMELRALTAPAATVTSDRALVITGKDVGTAQEELLAIKQEFMDQFGDRLKQLEKDIRKANRKADQKARDDGRNPVGFEFGVEAFPYAFTDRKFAAGYKCYLEKYPLLKEDKETLDKGGFLKSPSRAGYSDETATITGDRFGNHTLPLDFVLRHLRFLMKNEDVLGGLPGFMPSDADMIMERNNTKRLYQLFEHFPAIAGGARSRHFDLEDRPETEALRQFGADLRASGIMERYAAAEEALDLAQGQGTDISGARRP